MQQDVMGSDGREQISIKIFTTPHGGYHCASSGALAFSSKLMSFTVRGAVFMRLKLIVACSCLLLPIAIRAEIFVGNQESIAVFNNADNGQDYNPIKRLIKGDRTELDDVADLLVYQPGENENNTGIYACNRRGDGLIKVFPVGATGNVPPSYGIETLWPCEGLAISNGVLFTVPTEGGSAIELHDLSKVGTPIQEADEWEIAPISATLIKSISTPQWLDKGVQFFDIEVLGEQIFVLAKITGDLHVGLYVFDTEADEVSQPKRLVNDTQTHKAWGLSVFNDEIYVATSGTMTGYDLTTFDTHRFGSNALRYSFYKGRVKGPLREFLAYDSMVVDGELYVVGHTSGVYIFDARVGGIIPKPWRAIWNEELETSASIYVTSEDNPGGHIYELALEEPAQGAVYSGISNLRGWAVATEEISRVDILVNGVLLQSAPYGGARPDVAAAFPSAARSSHSGFSLAFNYNSLTPGEHTITARSYTNRGETLESSSTFTVQNFGSEFISDSSLVNLSGGFCETDGNSASFLDVLVDGSTFDIGLQWGSAKQGFEIVSIEEHR